jgi:hypothetical protein
MRTTRLTLTTGLAALSLFALAACTAPGSGGDGGTGPDGTGSDGSSGASGGLAGCMIGDWELDVDDLAGQLQAYFIESGTPVTSTEHAGTSTLAVTADTMTYDSAVSFTMTADSDGLIIIVQQDQVGTATGNWAVDGDSVLYSDWENGITITTTVTIEGQSAGDSTELPGDAGEGVAMQTSCDGDTLTTQPDASPFTSTWVRVG